MTDRGVFDMQAVNRFMGKEAGGRGERGNARAGEEIILRLMKQ